MTTSVLASVIIPCQNEQAYIAKCLDAVIAQDIDRNALEVIVVDGLSKDGSREIIADYARQHSFIKCLDNHEKTVPFGLNLGIASASGEFIIRMDVHCIYPSNYISSLIRWHGRLDADNVGAVLRTQPANDGTKAHAIAAATSHPFGVGNSLFRTGVQGVRAVDTVPFGCYKRELFTKIGFFDEELTRNQDDEFNGRLLRHKGTIYLVPDIVVTYFSRPDYKSLYRMYYQYGLFKPLVAKKLGSPTTARQFAPLALVLFFIFSIVTLVFTGWWNFLLYISVLYLSSTIVVSWIVGKQHCEQQNYPKTLSLWFQIALAFVTLHFSYGLGYLTGLIYMLLGRQRAFERDRIAISR